MNEEGKCVRNTGNVTTIDVPLGGISDNITPVIPEPETEE